MSADRAWEIAAYANSLALHAYRSAVQQRDPSSLRLTLPQIQATRYLFLHAAGLAALARRMRAEGQPWYECAGTLTLAAIEASHAAQATLELPEMLEAG